MPVEVIDLCSSPDIPPPSKTTASTAVAPTQSTTRPRPLPPVRALDYGDDVFDLTNVDDDDVSFLPAPRPNKAPRPPSPKTSRTDDFLFLSDDFDTTIDPLRDGSDPLDDHRPSKKPRISGESSTSARGPNSRSIQRSAAVAEKTGVEGPAVIHPTGGLKRWSTAFDPIQTTSSPLAPVSSNKRSSISSDPFASSPRQPEEIFDLSRDDVDPFASSRAKGEEGMVMTRKPAANPGVLGTSPHRARSKAPAPPKGSVAWDHISSSAPEPCFRDDDDWDLDVPPSRSGLTRSRSGGLDLGDLADLSGSSDDEEFPDLDSITKPTRSSSSSKARSTSAPRASVSKSLASTKARLTAEERAAVREAEKQRKQREKDEAKEQRRQEKERAAALAEVNKVRTNKNVSTPEMIVDLPSSMKPSVRLQVETLLEDLSVKHYPYTSPVNNVVKWRRKVKARFNEDAGYWEPTQQERIEPEKHAMVLMTAPEFVELALGAKGSDLEAHVVEVQRHYEGHAVIYLIEGLTLWMRKNRNVRNRQFQSAVRSAGADAANGPAAASASASASASDPTPAPPPPSGQAAPGRRKKDPKPPPQYIDEDTVEDALLQLQVVHDAKVHHTAAPVETAQWVAIFTQHISTIPYRRQRDAAHAPASFCMESGQVRTGDTPGDTYARMLQEIVRVTAPIAHGVASAYPTVGALVRGLGEGGPLVLAAIPKSANRDGAFTDRAVGPAVSRRMHKVFLGRDEASTDI